MLLALCGIERNRLQEWWVEGGVFHRSKMCCGPWRDREDVILDKERIV